MERNTEIETERDVLKRIVALLLSFAGLSERVCDRSYPVRCLVLWLLRRAEAVACDWVADDGDDDMPPALQQNSRAEAMHLARSFRALAHILKCQLRLEERFARRLTRGKTNRTAAWSDRLSPRHHVPIAGLLCRLAQTMRLAVRDLGFEVAPRLDTS